MALVLALPAATFGQAVLTVVHGIPLDVAQPVTVFANGGRVDSFSFGEAIGPLELPAGTYEIEVYLGDIAAPAGDPVAPLSPTVELADGVNYTAVAHLTESGAIAPLALFVNNVDNLGRWDSRLTVRHVASAPAVDVAVDRVLKWGRRMWKYPFVKALDIANTDDFGPETFGPVDFRSGLVQARLLAAGTHVQAAKSPVLRLHRGTAYVVYAIGELGGDFMLYVQEVE
jgi:hypothetical protein